MIPPDYFALDFGAGYAERFGPVHARVGEDGPRLGFRVAEPHGNIWGACHGRAITTFTLWTLWQSEALRVGGEVPNGPARPIRFSVDCLAAARLGDWVECEVLLAKATR